jgi:hypothetical protein
MESITAFYTRNRSLVPIGTVFIIDLVGVVLLIVFQKQILPVLATITTNVESWNALYTNLSTLTRLVATYYVSSW